MPRSELDWKNKHVVSRIQPQSSFFRLHWCGMACEIFFLGPLFILFSSTYTMLTKLFLPEFHFLPPLRAHIFCEAHTAILQRVLEYRLGNIFLAQAPSSKEKYYMVRVFSAKRHSSSHRGSSERKLLCALVFSLSFVTKRGKVKLLFIYLSHFLSCNIVSCRMWNIKFYFGYDCALYAKQLIGYGFHVVTSIYSS